MASNDFQLRAYVFLDSLQPQLAQYMAKTNKVYDPKEYDSALFVEIAPAMEIHVKIDQALKATNVRLGSMVTERVFGMMQVHHSDQGEVRAAGQAVLDASNLKESDRASCEILQNKIIRSVEGDHAIAFTGLAWGQMALAGDSVLIGGEAGSLSLDRLQRGAQGRRRQADRHPCLRRIGPSDHGRLRV